MYEQEKFHAHAVELIMKQSFITSGPVCFNALRKVTTFSGVRFTKGFDKVHVLKETVN